MNPVDTIDFARTAIVTLLEIIAPSMLTALVVGLAIVAGGDYILAHVSVTTTGPDLILPLAMTGVGMGLMFMALNTHLINAAPRNMVSRVTKYEHRLQEAYNFTRHETAILAELLLRGPQTPGELRTRADRMHKFDDLGIAQSTLQRLMKREPPLVKVLPRQPGTKEARYAHLLSGDVELPPQESAAGVATTSNAAGGDRIARLEDQVENLQNEIVELKQQFAAFRKQFE